MYRICVLFQPCTLSNVHIWEKRGAEPKLCPFSLSEGNANAVMMLTLVLAVCIPCGKSADCDRFKAGAAEPCKLVQDAEEMLVRFRDDHRGDARLAERVHNEFDVAEERQLGKLKDCAAIIEAVAVVVEKVGLRAVLFLEAQVLEVGVLSHFSVLQKVYSAGGLPFGSTHYNSFCRIYQAAECTDHFGRICGDSCT